MWVWCKQAAARASYDSAKVSATRDVTAHACGVVARGPRRRVREVLESLGLDAMPAVVVATERRILAQRLDRRDPRWPDDDDRHDAGARARRVLGEHEVQTEPTGQTGEEVPFLQQVGAGRGPDQGGRHLSVGRGAERSERDACQPTTNRENTSSTKAT